VADAVSVIADIGTVAQVHAAGNPTNVGMRRVNSAIDHCDDNALSRAPGEGRISQPVPH
jgi:hypothetical protein